MARGELLDSHVSSSQCKKAVTALANHATKVAKQREENELLPGKEEYVWLVLSVKKTTPEKKLKPFKIPLAHTIVDPRTTPVCLITKDPQREYKDLLASHNVKFISRVVGITKLKGKFRPFEARRMLMKENGLFLADERVVPLLPGLLGKMFFDAKKQPIPVSLTKKDLKGELEQAVSSTYMHQNQGSCTSVKIGTIFQSPTQLLDNLKTALPVIVKRIEGGWDNIQSFHIKTNSSASLPIWSCSLGQGGDARWEEPKAVDTEEGWTGFGEEEDVEDSESLSEEPAKSKADVRKGKKRSVEEGSELPKKKVKRSDVESLSKSAKPAKFSKTSGANHSSSDLPSIPKEGDARDTTNVSKIALTQRELKQKRAGEGLERKKEKAAKGKIGRSMKESIVGKKSKARI